MTYRCLDPTKQRQCHSRQPNQREGEFLANLQVMQVLSMSRLICQWVCHHSQPQSSWSVTALPTKDMPLLHAKQMESGNWLWTGPEKNAVKSHVSLCSSEVFKNVELCWVEWVHPVTSVRILCPKWARQSQNLGRWSTVPWSRNVHIRCWWDHFVILKSSLSTLIRIRGEGMPCRWPSQCGWSDGDEG